MARFVARYTRRWAASSRARAQAISIFGAPGAPPQGAYTATMLASSVVSLRMTISSRSMLQTSSAVSLLRAITATRQLTQAISTTLVRLVGVFQLAALIGSAVSLTRATGKWILSASPGQTVAIVTQFAKVQTILVTQSQLFQRAQASVSRTLAVAISHLIVLRRLSSHVIVLSHSVVARAISAVRKLLALDVIPLAVQLTGRGIGRILAVQIGHLITMQRAISRSVRVLSSHTIRVVRSVGAAIALVTTAIAVTLVRQVRLRVVLDGLAHTISLEMLSGKMRTFGISIGQILTLSRAMASIRRVLLSQTITMHRQTVHLVSVAQVQAIAIRDRVSAILRVLIGQTIGQTGRAGRLVQIAGIAQVILLLRSASGIIEITLRPVTALLRSTGRQTILTLSFAWAQAVMLRRSIEHIITWAQEVVHRRGTIKPQAIVIATASVVSVLRSTARIAAVLSSQTVSLVRDVVSIVQQTIVLLTSSTVQLRRSVSHVVVLLTSSVVALVRSIAHRVALAALPVVTTLVRSAGRLVRGVSAQLVTLRRQTARTLALLSAQLVTLRRGGVHLVMLLQGQTIALVRAARASIELTQAQSLLVLRAVGRRVVLAALSLTTTLRRSTARLVQLLSPLVVVALARQAAARVLSVAWAQLVLAESQLTKVLRATQSQSIVLLRRTTKIVRVLSLQVVRVLSPAIQQALRAFVEGYYLTNEVLRRRVLENETIRSALRNIRERARNIRRDH